MLSKAQMDELRRIAAGPPNPQFPAAGYFDTATGRSLVKRGLVRQWDCVKPLGGGGAVGNASVTWHLAELTEAGRKALEDESC